MEEEITEILAPRNWTPSEDIIKVIGVGGGGHAKAAGCVIENEPEQALSMLLAVIDEVWK